MPSKGLGRVSDKHQVKIQIHRSLQHILYFIRLQDVYNTSQVTPRHRACLENTFSANTQVRPSGSQGLFPLVQWGKKSTRMSQKKEALHMRWKDKDHCICVLPKSLGPRQCSPSPAW